MFSEATVKIVEATLEGDALATLEERARVRLALKPKEHRRRLGSTRQAAAALGVHPRTLLRYAHDHKLVAIYQSKRRVRFDMDAVERFAAEGMA